MINDAAARADRRIVLRMACGIAAGGPTGAHSAFGARTALP